MSKRQEKNNRSQGQRIRRINERIDNLTNADERMSEVVAQHDRDIRVMKSRLDDLEREKSQREQLRSWTSRMP